MPDNQVEAAKTPGWQVTAIKMLASLFKLVIAIVIVGGGAMLMVAKTAISI